MKLIPPLSPEDRKNLLAASAAFINLKPWEWMTDGDVFAVRNPETGELGYCTVLGNGGETFGMNVFLGQAGLEGYLNMADERWVPGDYPLMTRQDVIYLSLDDKRALDEEDLELLAQEKFRPKGRGRWPWFRRIRPGVPALPITGEEARFLTVALQRVCVMAERLSDEPDLLETSLRKRVLVQELAKGGDAWTEHWMTPTFDAPKPIAIAPEREALERLAADSKRLQGRKGDWELMVDLFPMPIDSDDLPFYPLGMLVYDPAQDEVIQLELVAPEAGYQGIVKSLIEVLTTTEQWPAHLHVDDDMAAQIAEAVASPLGIKVSRIKRLKMRDVGLMEDLLDQLEQSFDEDVCPDDCSHEGCGHGDEHQPCSHQEEEKKPKKKK